MVHPWRQARGEPQVGAIGLEVDAEEEEKGRRQEVPVRPDDERLVGDALPVPVFREVVVRGGQVDLGLVEDARQEVPPGEAGLAEEVLMGQQSSSPEGACGLPAFGPKRKIEWSGFSRSLMISACVEANRGSSTAMIPWFLPNTSSLGMISIPESVRSSRMGPLRLSALG
jgi:hypothetical protein